MILRYVKKMIKLIKDKKKWRKKNKENFTTITRSFDFSLCEIGKKTYGIIDVYSNGNDSKIIIGNYCSIAAGVKFIINDEHYINHISSYPFKVKINGEKQEACSKGDIVIDDDVWICMDAMILSGVHIGQGAIIAAGAVVTNDVPPYAIYGGVPAKLIRYRFPEEIVDKLLKIDYSKLSDKLIKENLEKFYCDVDLDTDLNWLPQKQ